MKNLTYEIKIDYVNGNGDVVTILNKIHENGLEVYSVKIGKECVTEEKINGRVLSGRLDSDQIHCGFVCDYEKNNGEYFKTINNEFSLDDAISLVRKTKRRSDFANTQLAFVPLSRNDHSIYVVNKGNIEIVKTACAEDEAERTYCVQEKLLLSKSEEAEQFNEDKREQSVDIGGCSVLAEDVAKDPYTEILIEVISKAPTSYKKLQELKRGFQTSVLTME